MLRNLIVSAIILAAFAVIYALVGLIREKTMHKKTTFGCLGSGACGNCMEQCEKNLAQRKQVETKKEERQRED